MAKSKETDEQAVWRIMMNAPGAQALALLETATKICVARNLVKPPRKREPTKATGKPGKDSAP